MDDDARLVLLGRAGCHLCDEARDVVARVAVDLGVTWVEKDVDSDPDLARRYTEMVPVVLLDGAQHAYWRVDEQRLRAALAAPARRSSWLSRWTR